MTERSMGKSQDGIGTDEYNWDTHWDAFGEAAARNPADSYRLSLVLRELDAGPGLTRILDIGSGQGELTIAIAARHPQAEVRGLEYSHSGVERARAAAGSRGSRVRFEQRDLMVGGAPSDERAWADAAVCSEVLEHLDDPAQFLSNAVSYIRPGGKLLVTVPAGPRSAFDHYIGHRRHYDVGSLNELLHGASLQDVRVKRAGFPFFNLYRLLIVARGRALISDVDSGPAGSASRRSAIRLASRVFTRAFELNLSNSPFGWQLVATATVQGSAA